MWAVVSFLRGPCFCPPSGQGTRVLQTCAPSGHCSATLRKTFGFTLLRSAPNLSSLRSHKTECLVNARCARTKAGHRWRSAQNRMSNDGSLRSHKSQATAPFGASATKDKIVRALKQRAPQNRMSNDNSVAALRTRAKDKDKVHKTKACYYCKFVGH